MHTITILFTCGGTAGHINPALALARVLEERRPGSKIVFVGAVGDGLEHTLVPRAGYELRCLNINSFRRSISVKSLQHNLKAVRNVARARRQARALLDELHPNLVVGTGGYASYPVVREAARRGIPTAIHESNAVPGLTTKNLSQYVDCVMIGFEDSRVFYPKARRVEVTGTPVRPDFYRNTRREARAALGLDPERPLLLSYWGSLGARVMNGQMADFIAMECAAGAPFGHIHGAGGGYDALMQDLAARGCNPADYPHIEVRPYIHDMPMVMAAADVVLCRAGASTISELTALGKPSILVPSPNVTGDHQTKNARLLAERGAAVLLPEPECTPQILYDTAAKLLQNPEARSEMTRNLAAVTPPDASERIYQILTNFVV